MNGGGILVIIDVVSSNFLSLRAFKLMQDSEIYQTGKCDQEGYGLFNKDQ